MAPNDRGRRERVLTLVFGCLCVRSLPALAPEQRQRLIDRTALGRIGRPEVRACWIVVLARARNRGACADAIRRPRGGTPARTLRPLCCTWRMHRM